MSEDAVDHAIAELGAADPYRRIGACTALAALGAAAARAVPALVRALEDRGEYEDDGPRNRDGELVGHFQHVAREAVLALARVAPGAAIDAVADAVLRLHSVRGSRLHGDYWRFLQWERAELAPFGPALIAALQAAARSEDLQRRSRARSVLLSIREPVTTGVAT
jgi:hypothetical protein